LIQLKQKNISGVIIGKALYENKFSLKDAIKTCLEA
jgi:phosphoribosylformimino-5-aminoimidazole carboxamide ribonucleotide (ProFAR) isomerase